MVNLFCHVTVIDILCLLIQDKAFVSHNISQNTHILFILYLGWWGLKMQRQQGLWWPSSWLWDSLWVPLSLLALKELCRKIPQADTSVISLSHYLNINMFQITTVLRHRYTYFLLFSSLYLVHSWACKPFKVYSIDHEHVLYIFCTFGSD